MSRHIPQNGRHFRSCMQTFVIQKSRGVMFSRTGQKEPFQSECLCALLYTTMYPTLHFFTILLKYIQHTFPPAVLFQPGK